MVDILLIIIQNKPLYIMVLLDCLSTVQDRCRVDAWAETSIMTTAAGPVVLRPVLSGSVKQSPGLEQKATDGIYLTRA